MQLDNDAEWLDRKRRGAVEIWMVNKKIMKLVPAVPICAKFADDNESKKFIILNQSEICKGTS